MSHITRNLSSGFLTRSKTNRAAQPQKMARFRIKGEEGLYYPCSKNIGADQLCGYRIADLRLFLAYAKSGFSHEAAYYKACIEYMYS